MYQDQDETTEENAIWRVIVVPSMLNIIANHATFGTSQSAKEEDLRHSNWRDCNKVLTRSAVSRSIEHVFIA